MNSFNTKVVLTSLMVMAIGLTGCGMFSSGDSTNAITSEGKESNHQTLGEVYFEPLPLDHEPLAQSDTESLRNAYKGLLGIVADPKTKQIVQYRLADLEVMLAEQKQEAGQPVVLPQPADSESNKPGQKLFDLAINQYQALLSEHPGHPDNVEVLYQLAKAHEQQGQMQESFDTMLRLLKQYPENPYLAEIYFRIGEVEFNRSQYVQAISAYNKVIEQGEQSAYYGTAAYMLGWSYFKNEEQNKALKAFTLLLDHNLPNEIIAESMLSQVDSAAQIERLSIGAKRLVNDTIRIMSLLFSYQDSSHEKSADSVRYHFTQVGSRHYEYVLYDALAQHYLNKDRYRDSGQVYQTFTGLHPQHFQAPIFAVKQIDVYILGKFPTLVLPAKQAFVLRYGIAGEFWNDWPLVLKEQVGPYLNQYLQELAQFEHSRAQMLVEASLKADTEAVSTGTGSKTEKAPSLPSAEALKKQANAAYLLAAKWYKQFIQTFPHDEQTAELTFRLGETLFEAGVFAESIQAFETYAYEHLKQNSSHEVAHPKASEAGYAAILGYREIQQSTAETDISVKAQWLDKQLVSQENFVNAFAKDPRALDVLHISTQQLFTLERYKLAIASGQKLLAWQPQADADKRLASHLVIGHSQFALAEYAFAETKYQQIVGILDENDPRLEDMRERLAASIYKQGEENVRKNYLPLAVNDFLRVLAKTPESSIRLNAQYDAATYLLEMKEWQQAIDLLEDFRLRFPKDKLTENIADKLISAYQQNEDWQQAADELLVLHKGDPQSEEGRQALYVAAQYLHKIGNIPKALDSYRTYAHSYPVPFAEANEARFIMSEFYLKSNEGSKRRFWLNKLIKADEMAQTDSKIERTTRSRYLAAMASKVFADDTLYVYKRIKLTQPLKASLAKKKSALNKALAAYNKTLAYKVEEFSTSANFSVADIYHQLAKDLMASSRPKNLNELELEQYELLLEEQAYPFEEKAIDIHETNAKRSWTGSYDEWVQQSFSALKVLLPGRYNKQEQSVEVADEVY